jgi:hypothetical protein
MEWLYALIGLDSIVKLMVFTVLLVKYLEYKNKIIFYWMLAWLFFALHPLFDLAATLTSNSWCDLSWFLHHLMYALTGVALFQSAVYMKSDSLIKRFKVPLALLLLSIVFAFVGVFVIGVDMNKEWFWGDWFWGAFLVAVINGIGFIIVTLYFYSYTAGRRNPATYMMVVALILNCIHNLDYPFLRPVMRFAPHGFGVCIILSLFFGISSVLLVFPKWYIKPITESITPVVTEKKYELSVHQSYLVKEEKPRKSFEIFINEIEHGAQGLIVTRQYPDKVRKKYGLEKTPIIWLSTRPGENNMDPTNIATLIHVIINFIQKSENSILLVDAVEYLVSNNDFQIILRAIERLNEEVMQCNSRLIISLDPRTLEMNELAVLGRNMKIIESN